MAFAIGTTAKALQKFAATLSSEASPGLEFIATVPLPDPLKSGNDSMPPSQPGEDGEDKRRERKDTEQKSHDPETGRTGRAIDPSPSGTAEKERAISRHDALSDRVQPERRRDDPEQKACEVGAHGQPSQALSRAGGFVKGLRERAPVS